MILVDVYVPALNKTYDFQVDENSRIEVLTAELVEMLCSELHQPDNKEAWKFLLCSMDERTILGNETSLSINGIRNGSRLMLV